ncbi:hypothetical protein SAMN05421747_1025 [Parapedobacter composti]|uniref:Uncharacterized protein n=1 Tax=Parapedobacter composti TaxID=623281 RepID=A0A1I1ETB7_9SPHI|nr:hypothetical protein SAMN05421747_1025 [Parapedobacter composti]
MKGAGHACGLRGAIQKNLNKEGPNVRKKAASIPSKINRSFLFMGNDLPIQRLKAAHCQNRTDTPI